MSEAIFKIETRSPDSPARVGRLRVGGAVIPTPAFMPVGTRGAVKAVTPEEVAAIGYRLILANTFHLDLRPGSRIVERLGGLHRFMNWPHAILTDSGGYQVFSLAKMRKIDEEGAAFQSPYDGSACRLTPESAIEIQHRLGADVIMAFDECLEYPAERGRTRESMERTLRWLERCRRRDEELMKERVWAERGGALNAGGLSRQEDAGGDACAPRRQEDAGGDACAPNTKRGPVLFGIVQGGFHADLRGESARRTAEIDLPGYAVGGLSVGEPAPLMMEMLDAALAHLPAERPRYAMGVGLPLNLIDMAARGVDLFDCVVPTRNARNGRLYTFGGTVVIKHAEHRESSAPIEEGCPCEACRHYSRAYLRHLYMANEILASRLATIHNLTFFHRLMERVREAIAAGGLTAMRAEVAVAYAGDPASDEL
jgi:queuine tRNA-ribosyltransferase